MTRHGARRCRAGPSSGAVVILRPASGAERQTATARRRSVHALRSAGGAAVLIVRAGGFAESRQTLGSATPRRVDVVLAPAGVSETVTVTATRGEQRTGDLPASVSVIGRAGDPAVAGGGRRRRAAADSDLQPVPPHQQPVVASDGAGRVAARHRPERREPHAGAARRRAVQRSVRRLGLLDARAARQRSSASRWWTTASSSLYGNYAMGGVINLDDRRRPARRTVEVRVAVRQPRQPEGRCHGQRRVGQGRGRRSTAARSTPTATRSSRAAERGAVDNNAAGRFPQRQRQAAVRPDRSRSRPTSGSATSARIATTARPARSTAPRKPTTRRGRRSAAAARVPAAGREHSAGRACPATSRRSAATSWRCRPPRRRAASAG